MTLNMTVNFLNNSLKSLFIKEVLKFLYCPTYAQQVMSYYKTFRCKLINIVKFPDIF